MRNFPIQANQNPVSPSDLAQPEKGRKVETFLSSTTGKWKATEKLDGEYVRWTQGRGYDSPEEAVKHLQN